MLTVFTKWNKQQNKPLENVISDIYGIGNATSKSILYKQGIQKYFKLGRLTNVLQKKISQIVELDKSTEDISLITESILKEQHRKNIEVLKTIKSYRGMRHLLGLSVRGQRTKTNAKTQKRLSPGIRVSKKNTSYKRVTKTKHTDFLGESSTYIKLLKKRSRKRVFY